MELEKRQKRFIIVLLTFDFIYLLLEIILNASVFELSSGLIVSQEKIEDIESFGRTLSGIGLTLTILAFIKPPKTIMNKLALAFLISCFSIPFMHILQNYIVDDLIVAKSTPEDRGAAELLVTYRDGMTLGKLHLGKAIPFNMEDSKNPEELAMTSIFALSIFNDYSVSILRNGYDYFEETKELEKDRSLDRIYPYYEKSAKMLKEAIKVNNMMHINSNDWHPAVYKMSAMAYEELEKTADTMFEVGKEKEKEILAHFEEGISHYKFYKMMTKCASKHGGSYSCFVMRNVMKNLTKIKHDFIAKGYFFKDNFCQKGCPKTKEEYAKRLLMFKKVSEKYKEEFGFTPLTYKNSKELLYSQDFHLHTSFELRDKLDIEDSQCIRGKWIYGRNEKEVKNCITDLIGKQKDLLNVENPFPDFINGERHHTEETILKHPEVVKKYKQMMGYFYLPQVKFIETKEEFVSLYDDKKNMSLVKKNMSKMAENNYIDFAEGGIREKEGELYIKALYVPPIALLFSLFFAFLTLSRIVSRIFTLFFFDKKRLRKCSILVSSSMIALFVFAPIYLMDNKFTSEQSIGRLEILRGEAFTKTEKMVVKWSLIAQPIIYKIGEPLVREFEVRRDR